ncbi:hypothetical protein ACP49_06935 [Clostridium botulinum]|uniref:hypothetical protein n=1 Tax=Clostridium botulinum TaxID=1491 RepID=UPI0005F951AD|nr:hypothetical protein [Clostridium botulinum]KOM98442.1 hypothetical protein ACP53_01380 [Clostridium botulinum]KON00309.1 hypothetical protein ACP49_06935 [Clostridium botulinum]MBY7003083.1 hypothetical protein [Clostridium botulinum]MCR1146447.1 hypothetical protein [Clostridium botulinum]NFH92670.1 hypothetical protein [Clostridium botulinum]
MSISLALIPAVLTLKVVMNEKDLDNWVENSKINMPTTLKNEEEIIKTLKQAGYKINKYGNYIKTEINGEKEFVTWEKENGIWNVVFSKYDSKEMIVDFIMNLNNKAGREVIYKSIEEMKNRNDNSTTVEKILELPKVEKEIFPTNFGDKDLLLKTLKECGACPKEISNEDIQCNTKECQLIFHKEEDGSYNVEIEDTSSLKNVFHHLSIIDEEYKHNVQEYTYKKVVEKLNETDMYIDNEEVLEDNSILLTVNIGD